MKTNFQNEKAFWQKYTDEDLTEKDIFEINRNLLDFAGVLLKMKKELQNEENGESKTNENK